MKKRWRWLLLTAPLAALAMGAWWWHRSTPPWESAWVQWGQEDSLRYAYEGELRLPSVAQAIGYSMAQQKADEAVRAHSAEGWRKVDDETKRMMAAGASESAIARFRNSAATKAIEKSQSITKDWLPSLTTEQKTKLWPRMARWTGIWILADRRVAARVGLSEAQRKEIERTADRVRWYYNDEHNAWGRQVYIYDGAPASAIAALGEQQRHMIRCQDRVWDEACQAEGREITKRTGFSPSRSMPSWIDTLAYDLVVRRAITYRREEEARLLKSLTPTQHQRWEELRAGKDPV